MFEITRVNLTPLRSEMSRLISNPKNNHEKIKRKCLAGMKIEKRKISISNDLLALIFYAYMIDNQE